VATSSSSVDTLPYPDRTGFLAPVAAETDRFRTVLAGTDPAARVPSCPDWSAADLLWHLTEVQAFWAAVCEAAVAGTVLDDDAVEALEEAKPERPGSYGELLSLAETCSTRLLVALRAGSPSDPAWSWFSADRTLGFSMRRQAHEALVHRVDAELAAGLVPSRIEPALAADGVDELLRVMWGLPEGDWVTWTPSGQHVRLTCTDTGHSWTVAVGRWSGTGPASGREFDDVTAVVVDGHDEVEPAAEIRANAADLDLYLWNRLPHTAVERSGDEGALAVVDEVRTAGVQ
jgi:uncharacterized protein (TIGR03083 family)